MISKFLQAFSFFGGNCQAGIKMRVERYGGRDSSTLEEQEQGWALARGAPGELPQTRSEEPGRPVQGGQTERGRSPEAGHPWAEGRAAGGALEGTWEVSPQNTTPWYREYFELTALEISRPWGGFPSVCTENRPVRKNSWLPSPVISICYRSEDQEGGRPGPVISATAPVSRVDSTSKQSSGSQFPHPQILPRVYLPSPVAIYCPSTELLYSSFHPTPRK